MRSLLFYTFFTFSISYSQFQKGLDIDGEAMYDQSGWAIDMPDKSTLAIGASNNDGNGNGSGHVRVFSWTGANWIQKGLDIDGAYASDWFGRSVSMADSNNIAIGAPGNDWNGQDAGHVRVYKWQGNTWVQKGQDIHGEATDNESGRSLSMPDSNTVAIGAPFNDDNGIHSGHVRIFKWNDTAWVQKGQDIDGANNGDWFGHSISMPDSNTIAIGALYNDGGGSRAGHAQIYVWNGVAWVQKGYDIEGTPDDRLGYSISMPDANTVGIGAPFNNASGTDIGYATIYSWNGINWVQKGTNIEGEASGNWLGCSVSMSDSNNIVVGASARGNNQDTGYVKAYRWNGSNWVQNGNTLFGEVDGDWFGSSVSMPDINTFASGAPANNGNGHSSGHVRVFSTNQTVSITKNKISKNIAVYPNPVVAHTHQFLNINFGELKDHCIVELKDLTGKLIHKAVRKSHEPSLRLSLNGKTGIYLLTVTTKNESYTTKIIKQ